MSYKLARQANGEDGCCHLVKGIVSCPRVKKNAVLLQSLTLQSILTSLSELFQWQVVRSLSGPRFWSSVTVWDFSECNPSETSGRTSYSSGDNNKTSCVQVLPPMWPKQTTWQWSKISVAKLLWRRDNKIPV